MERHLSEGVYALNQEKKLRFKYRIKYTKGPELRFVSHLDLMRLFQRAVRRAGLPIGYSHGFNPHQLMSFGNPLSLGMTSTGEYCDFEFEKAMDTDEIVDRLNAVMNEGVTVFRAARLSQEAKSAMAELGACEYEAYLHELMPAEGLAEKIAGFLAQKEIIVMKKTKNHIKETDIRPDIYSIEDISKDGKAAIKLVLAAGSIQSLRADLTVETFCKYAGVEFDKYKVRYNRTEMYRVLDGKFVPLDKEVAEG